MGRFLLTAVACGALAVAAGCISYEQHTTFEKDGSGRMVVDVWVDYLGEEAEDGENVEGKPAEPEISEELGSAFADVKGVTVEENWAKIEGEGEEQREHTRLGMAFDKVENLTGLGIFENQKLSFEKKGKTYAFTQTIHNEKKEAEEAPDGENEELAQALFEGYTFTYTIVMPGKVVDTNGEVGDDERTVTWVWPLYEFTNQEEIVLKATSE